MAPVRGIGNILIRAAFRVLIGSSAGDLLSGYRAFNRHYRDTVKLHGGGFEVETELASEAIGRGMRVVEVPVPYYPRVGGGVSKLNAFRDGRRILWTIFKQSARLRLLRLLLVVALFLMVCVSFFTETWINILTGVFVFIMVVADSARWFPVSPAQDLQHDKP